MIKCKHKLFPGLFFKNTDDEVIFKEYLEFKGIYLHKHIYDLLKQYKGIVDYNELSTCIKYEKGLRNVLYRNLSAVEEYYRSKLINTYDIKFRIENLKKDTVKSENLIHCNSDSSNLYRFTFSKQFSFNKLLDLIKSTELVSEKEIIDLKKIRDFRNKVMHHNLIIASHYDSKSDVEANISDVEEICKLIYIYLPVPMRNAFEGNINTCNHITNKNKIPKLDILCLGEMKDGLFK